MNIAVVDLGFGDAGKGTITDFLVRHLGADRVVRFNGGAQAGHNVITPDGRHHTFAQFGAGSFVPGVLTLLGPDFLLHPLGMAVEAEHLEKVGVHDIWQRTFVDARARVITPFQQATNHWRELQRGASAHGSCGVGVGECVADSLSHDDTVRAADLSRPARLRSLLERQHARHRQAILATGAALPGIFDDPGLVDRVLEVWTGLGRRIQLLEDVAHGLPETGVVFEGAQGVLLDEWWGFHPHTTWSDCTFGGVTALTAAPFHRLGVLRSFGVRHGPGPFPGEGKGAADLQESHNADGRWQGPVRTGAFDSVLLRYALEVCGGVDSIALTHLDRVERGPVVTAIGEKRRLEPGGRFDLEGRAELTAWLGEAEVEVAVCSVVDVVRGEAPVSIESRGPRATEKVVVGDLGGLGGVGG
ncbi:MAG: adenylosuccinate synthase [Myxococcota bacterium]